MAGAAALGEGSIMTRERQAELRRWANNTAPTISGHVLHECLTEIRRLQAELAEALWVIENASNNVDTKNILLWYDRRNLWLDSHKNK